MGPSPATQFVEAFSTPLGNLLFLKLARRLSTHTHTKELGGRMQIGNGNIDNINDLERLKVQIKLSELLQVAQEASSRTLKQLRSN